MITDIDMAILRAIQNLHTPWLDEAMCFFTNLVQEGILTVWVVAAIAMLFFRNTRKCGIQMLLASLICACLNEYVLRDFFARMRPCQVDMSVATLISRPAGFSFPSGHTSHSFTAAMILYLNHRQVGKPALVFAGIIGFSRMYLFVHYLTDVLGGVMLGLLVAFGVYYIWRIPKKNS